MSYWVTNKNYVPVNTGTPSGSNFSNATIAVKVVTESFNHLANTRITDEHKAAKITINNSVTAVFRTMIPVYQSGISYGLQNNVFITKVVSTVFKNNLQKSMVPQVIKVLSERLQPIFIIDGSDDYIGEGSFGFGGGGVLALSETTSGGVNAFWG